MRIFVGGLNQTSDAGQCRLKWVQPSRLGKLPENIRMFWHLPWFSKHWAMHGKRLNGVNSSNF